MKKYRWAGIERNRWSGERREKKWFPNSIQNYLVHKCIDSTNAEATSIYFKFHSKTGKVYGIINHGKMSKTHIIVRFRCENILAPNWTREYVISPNKDGEDYSYIDIPMSVKDLILEKDKGKWKFADNVEVTITEQGI